MIITEEIISTHRIIQAGGIEDQVGVQVHLRIAAVVMKEIESQVGSTITTVAVTTEGGIQEVIIEIAGRNITEMREQVLNRICWNH